MDPNSNEYLTNPANIYVRNSKPPKNTILIDLKINKTHVPLHRVFKKRDSPRDSWKSLSHKTKQKVYVTTWVICWEQRQL